MGRRARRRRRPNALDAALRPRPDFAEASEHGRLYPRARAARPKRRCASISARSDCKRRSAGRVVEPRQVVASARPLRGGARGVRAALAIAPDDADALNIAPARCARWAGSRRRRARRGRRLRRRPDFAEAALNLGTALLKAAGPRRRSPPIARPAACAPITPTRSAAQALALRALGPARRGARGVRPRRGARLPRGGERARLPRSDARRFRARLGGLRGALGRRQIDRRGARRALSAMEGARTTPPQRVLVLNDHGLGDTIQFSRYLPHDGAGRRRAAFRLPRQTASPARPDVGGARLRRKPRPSVRTFDAQIAMSSLPRAFGTRLDSVPADVPYLFAEPERVAALGRADRRARFQDRLRLAGQCQSRGRHRALVSARAGLRRWPRRRACG